MGFKVKKLIENGWAKERGDVQDNSTITYSKTAFPPHAVAEVTLSWPPHVWRIGHQILLAMCPVKSPFAALSIQWALFNHKSDYY